MLLRLYILRDFFSNQIKGLYISASRDAFPDHFAQSEKPVSWSTFLHLSTALALVMTFTECPHEYPNTKLFTQFIQNL